MPITPQHDCAAEGASAGRVSQRASWWTARPGRGACIPVSRKPLVGTGTVHAPRDDHDLVAINARPDAHSPEGPCARDPVEAAAVQIGERDEIDCLFHRAVRGAPVRAMRVCYSLRAACNRAATGRNGQKRGGG